MVFLDLIIQGNKTCSILVRIPYVLGSGKSTKANGTLQPYFSLIKVVYEGLCENGWEIGVHPRSNYGLWLEYCDQEMTKPTADTF